MFLLKHWEIEIRCYVTIIQEAFFLITKKLKLCPDRWQSIFASPYCIRRLHHWLQRSSFTTLLHSILKLPQFWSLKYIFPSKQYSTAGRNWLNKADFFSFHPISLLLIFNSKAEDCNFKNKNGNENSAKNRVILVLGFFPQWLSTARTLPRFQDCHFFKAEAKEFSSGGKKNQNCKFEIRLLSRFLMNFISFTVLWNLKLF